MGRTDSWLFVTPEKSSLWSYRFLDSQETFKVLFLQMKMRQAEGPCPSRGDLVGHAAAPICLCFGEKGDDGFCRNEVPYGRLWGVGCVVSQGHGPFVFDLGTAGDRTTLCFAYSVRWARLWKHQLRGLGEVEGTAETKSVQSLGPAVGHK